MSFQAAGDFARTAAAPAAMLPPLEAALGLVSNIEQSITLFKANRHEVKDLGDFSRELAEKLAPASTHHTKPFVVVIEDIQDFVVKVSTKRDIIQYIQRSSIAAKLADFRKKLHDAFVAFDVTMQIDMSKAHNAAEIARQEDQQETKRGLDSLSNDVLKIAEALGIPGPMTDASVRVQELKELEATSATSEGQSPQEQVVLGESIQLLRILDPNYDWWSETFKKEASYDDVAGELTSVIDNLSTGLGDLLAKGVRIKMSHRDPPGKVDMLIRELNTHNRNAVLIRSFQRELRKNPQVQFILV